MMSKRSRLDSSEEALNDGQDDVFNFYKTPPSSQSEKEIHWGPSTHFTLDDEDDFPRCYSQRDELTRVESSVALDLTKKVPHLMVHSSSSKLSSSDVEKSEKPREETPLIVTELTASTSSKQLSTPLRTASKRGYETIDSFDLGQGIRVSFVRCDDGHVIAHIRTFTIDNRPTMDGVTMVGDTFLVLCEKLSFLKLGDCTAGFVINNTVLVLCREESVSIQNINRGDVPKLKPYNVSLFKSHLLNFKKISFEMLGVMRSLCVK